MIALTRPSALVKFPRGKGCILLDQVKWDTEERNPVKAARYASAILLGLGADFTPFPQVSMEAEEMEREGAKIQFSWGKRCVEFREDAWLGRRVTCERGGEYVFELVARAKPVEKKYPSLEIQVNGRLAGAVQTKSKTWQSYRLPVTLARGSHEIKLSLQREGDVSGGRRAFLDKVIIYPISGDIH